MTRPTCDPRDPVEPLLAWFNAGVNEHKHDIAVMIEGLGDTEARQASGRLATPYPDGTFTRWIVPVSPGAPCGGP
jgi:hypothetical protein